MRALASAILVALAAGFTLHPAIARADRLDAPAEVMAHLDGSFGYSCTFHKEAGSSRLAGYSWYGVENVQGGLFADCFCDDFCPIYSPGDTFTFEVNGRLTDPTVSGRVQEQFILCTSGGASASTVVRPFSTTGAGAPASTGTTRFWNEPNPFRTRTTFYYELPEAGPVTLGIYDLAGRFVAIAVGGVQSAGPHEVSWDVRADGAIPRAGGVLFARLTFGGVVRSRPLIVSR